MFYNNIDPVLIYLGPLEIRYYGIIYALGFVLAYIFLKKHGKDVKLAEQDLDNLMLYLVIGIVIGARIFYILLYNLDFYLQQPLEMIKLWHGGLSFHGGLVGGIVAGLLFCRRKKLSFLKVADLISIPLALALFFGRIANFINGELYGRVTQAPWAVKFRDADGFRHPSQLYEAAKNAVIFMMLLVLRKKKLKDGMVFASFIILYGILRFFIEFFREPEVYVGILTMGQLLSLIVAIAGIMLLVIARKKSV